MPFATVQIKEHFCCTNQKTCVIDIFTRIKNRVGKSPVIKLPGYTTTGLRDLTPPIHSN